MAGDNRQIARPRLENGFVRPRVFLKVFRLWLGGVVVIKVSDYSDSEVAGSSPTRTAVE